MNETRSSPPPELIAGRNSVAEALRSGRPVDSLLIAKGERSGSIRLLIAQCRDRGIPVKEVDPRKLTAMCGGPAHQGVALIPAAAEYAEMKDIYALAESRGEPLFVVIADEIADPHNLGALVRTAEAAGAHGVIIPKRRAAGLTLAVSKAAAGALEYLPVVRVGNLAAAVDELKARGAWVYAADMGGANWCETDFSGPVVLIVGSEGEGIGRLLREKCDFTVSMPMLGKITSLNASVAAGVILYEIARQRQGIRAVAPKSADSIRPAGAVSQNSTNGRHIRHGGQEPF